MDDEVETPLDSTEASDEQDDSDESRLGDGGRGQPVST